VIKPRPYQIEAVNAVLGNFGEGIERQLISLPTGTGKTVIFGLLVKDLSCGTLILAHREELLTQAEDKLRMINPNLDVGILQAGERSGLRRKICVASVQTAINHIPELRYRDYSLMIIDEAHHSAARSYKRLVEDLGFTGGGKLLVGVTATAFRGDKQELGDVFEKIVYEKTVWEMIYKGYLCDVRGIQVGTDVNLSDVHTRSGDFALDELETAVDTPERNELIVDAYQKHCEGKKAVVFAVSVEHARKIREAFIERGISCEAIWGSQDNKTRKAVLDTFLNGGYKVLSNCMILTEGFDAPDIEAILMARPTKSRGLYIQCVGRGLRLAPGKKECLVLDFVDVSGKHFLCDVGILTKKRPKNGESIIEAEERERREQEEQEQEEQEERRKRVSRAPVKKATQEVDLFHRSKIAWSGGINGIYRITVGDGMSIVCAPEGSGYRVYSLTEGNGTVNPVTDEVLPLSWARGAAEDCARSVATMTLIDKTARWRKDPATGKQLEQLTRYGIPHGEDITKGEAVDLMAELFNQPATDKQVWYIRQKRLHQYPELLTKRAAGRLISEYKAEIVS
jgi:superfamily II DNA or RNA helicase